ncbi:PHB depolymerase family esterase [Dactylosporangium sp. NPDC000244]|uniref:alpha/beta hydrolase family esterase n=1 Tax=Dactylosporangium sp. NPDC000244 TaxID=3154365 RepID=UPI003321E23B
MDRRQLLQTTAALAATTVLGTELITTGTAQAAGKAPGDLGAAQPLDGRPFPAYDYTRANKLPKEMTGYWTKSFTSGDQTRTAKIYISLETPIRSYYTVIAVPDGIDTADFLRRTSWRDIADDREEGLFILEPGEHGWGTAADEAEYVNAALAFYESNRYFSIFGEHYFVGYGHGAPALEAWAVAHPLKAIAQVYLDSTGLDAAYLDSYASREFDGRTSYTPVVFPEGFDLIRYDETVLPTWYINPDERSASASLAYWKRANDTAPAGASGGKFGTVYRQRPESDRWMTSHAGPISQVAVQKHPVDALKKETTRQIVEFLTAYTRYENSFAYGNQLYERADYARLGVQVHTMMVEGFVREYLVYVPRSATSRWHKKAPVLFVFPGDSQTDKVFVDATQWWKVAEQEGFILVVVCEQYSSTSVVVSHKNSVAFYRQLHDLVIQQYPADPTRVYATGQSAGGGVSQSFAIAYPEYFAAVASTSFPVSPNSSGNISFDGGQYPASYRAIPNYMIYGYGDLSSVTGTLWDNVQNGLDSWARYHLQVDGLQLSDVDTLDGKRSGWHNRFQTWTWREPGTAIPILKVTKNNYRSHNTMAEECPLLWDFVKHYSIEVDASGRATRYYSPSGFQQPGDKRRV